MKQNQNMNFDKCFVKCLICFTRALLRMRMSEQATHNQKVVFFQKLITNKLTRAISTNYPLSKVKTCDFQ